MDKQKEAVSLVKGWGKDYIDALLSSEVDEYGIITPPGKFEFEHFTVKFFWNVALEGAADEEIYDPDYDTPYYVFKLVQWKNLIPKAVYGQDEYLWLVLWEDDSGFVLSGWLTKDDLNELRENIQKKVDEQDE